MTRIEPPPVVPEPEAEHRTAAAEQAEQQALLAASPALAKLESLELESTPCDSPA